MLATASLGHGDYPRSSGHDHTRAIVRPGDHNGGGDAMNGMLKGELKHIGAKRYAYETADNYQCVDCKTDFPLIDGVIRCNGAEIMLCPWCRDDSTPWQNGRGI